jgi:amidase
MYEELTISTYHERLRDGSITTSALVAWYLERIREHMEGRGLNAVVSVNEAAAAEAAECDERLAASADDLAPLHGVPVLIKDQGETQGIRTSFGNRLFRDYIPDEDAAVVARLKRAGAIILGKSAMCDFAAGWFSSSSLTGHTVNAYDAARDSGGSSAGSGAGVAANLCLVAIGEDTGGSIRIPASFNNSYGLRVTTGVIPRTGFSPLVHFQDTPGPMARTVEDVARVLDVIGGYDPSDPYTAVATQLPELGTIASGLRARVSTLAGWRIGIVESALGDGRLPAVAPVNAVFDAALQRLGGAGLDIARGLDIDDLGGWIGRTSVYARISKSDLTRFMSTRRGEVPVRDFTALYEAQAFHPENDLFHDIVGGADDVATDLVFLNARIDQGHFQRLVLSLFAQSGVDFLVYPTVKVVPPTFDDLEHGTYTCLTFPTNTVIASQAGLPALSIPAGFTAEGLPVGLDVVGRPFSEARILAFAADVEPVLDARRAPSHA